MFRQQFFWVFVLLQLFLFVNVSLSASPCDAASCTVCVMCCGIVESTCATCVDAVCPGSPSPTPFPTLEPEIGSPLKLTYQGRTTNYVLSRVTWSYQIGNSGNSSDPPKERFYVDLAICDLYPTQSQYEISTRHDQGTLMKTYVAGKGSFYVIRWEGIFHTLVSVSIAGPNITDQASVPLTWYYSVVGTEEGVDPNPVPGPGCFEFICPLDCGSHGECVQGEGEEAFCSCEQYYEGVDCSIYVFPLKPLVPFSRETRYEWVYFTFSSFGSDQSWVLTLDGFGSCDIYVNFNDFPSERNYLARNLSHTPQQTITLKDEPKGLYYGGVYGYCSFTIRASYCGPCGEHGKCFDGQCLCDQGFGGSNCLIDMVKVEPHKNPYEASATGNEWTYFYFVSDQDYSEVDWIVESQSHHAHMSLALREGEPPTFWNNDDMIGWFSASQKAFINQTYTKKGVTYYFGVYGSGRCATRGNCDFTLRLQVTTPDNCPNACSLHSSSCHGSGCVCRAGYSGVECEEYIHDAGLGVTYSGYVGGNAWNYYHILGNTRESYVVGLDLTSSRKECELYVNGGSYPTLTEFGYFDTSNPGRIVIPDPIGETWFIGIYGRKSPCTYNLRIDETTTCGCAPHPAGHGSCQKHSAICVCNVGWVGDDCSEPVRQIKSGVPVRDESVEREGWNYYYLDAKDSSAFALTLKEHNTTGFVWFFISHSEYPSLNSYDYSEKSSDTPVHEVTFFTHKPQTESIFLGVFGSPFIPRHTPKGDVVKISYDLEAWKSNF